jgi:hypothetical protein
MSELNKLSRAGLEAAMRGGTKEWGERASIIEHIMYVEPQTARGRHYLKCRCGCKKNATHRAMANGICMSEGCEFSMQRWAKQANASRVRALAYQEGTK